MTCNHYRDLISADVDGELGPEAQHELSEHLKGCLACQTFQQDAWQLRRALRVTPVESLPSQDPVAGIAGPLQAVSALRWVLFVIGGTLVILNFEAVLFAPEGGAAHLGRHDGVFGTALGIGMLAVAAKPHRAIGLVPITSTIAVLMFTVAVIDLLTNQASLWGEAIHVIEFAGLICLWVISGGPSRLNERATAALALVRRPAIGHPPIA